MSALRFLLFSGNDRPTGGWDDFVGNFESLKIAIIAAAHRRCDGDEWWHVVDVQTMEIVADHSGEV